MSDIVVFGSFVVDLMARSAHIPVPGETIKSSLFRMGLRLLSSLLRAMLQRH